MIVLRNKAEVTISYPVEQLADKEKILFFDIETTGFSRKYCHIYLIGCMYYVKDTLMYTQWFAENKNDEANVLMAFYQFMKKFDTIIHFNGNSFDIPFIMERGKKYNLAFDFSDYRMIDIYKSVSGMNHILKIENQKQKTFELLLGIHRTDPFSGGDLVEIYHEYVRTKGEKLLLPLLLHNKEDVWNMALLLSLLSISDLFHGEFHIDEFSINRYKDINEENKQELRIVLSLVNIIPIKISYHWNDIHLIAQDHRVQLSIPVIHDTLKFFFDNYKDYYYLPVEDCAIHKSVASFVEHQYRKAATKATCYEKIKGDFIPYFENNSLFTPHFQTDNNDKTFFIKADSLTNENINSYTLNILNHCKTNPKVR